MLKVTRNTTRQGQTQGQVIATVAAQHGVSRRWLRLVAFGSLGDAACVRALCRASATPTLWALVAPATKAALFEPTLKVQQLGGSRDHLLAMLLEALAILRHPANQNYAREHTVLDYVNLSLDHHLELQADDERDRGRRSIKSVRAAREKKTEDADARALRYLAAVESRGRRTKNAVYVSLAAKENTTPEAIKKTIARLRTRRDRPLQPHSN